MLARRFLRVLAAAWLVPEKSPLELSAIGHEEEEIHERDETEKEDGCEDDAQTLCPSFHVAPRKVRIFHTPAYLSSYLLSIHWRSEPMAYMKGSLLKDIQGIV